MKKACQPGQRCNLLKYKDILDALFQSHKLVCDFGTYFNGGNGVKRGAITIFFLYFLRLQYWKGFVLEVCAFGRCALLTGVWILKERVSLFTPPAYLIDKIVLKTGGVSMKKKH